MIRANLQLTDFDAEGRPVADDLSKVASPLSVLLTQELDGAAEALNLTSDEILLAALGRAIQRTIGDGTVSVDIPSHGACVHPLTLRCAPPTEVTADEMLADVHDAHDGLTVHHIVHGVPDEPRAQPLADVLFTHGEAASTTAHLGHVLELRAYDADRGLALDWWFDERSFEPYTIAELAEQLPLAIIELTSEATPTVRATAELAMAH